MDWILDLLTTCTHHSKLQVITALSLLSTLYKSQQHPLSLFQPAVSATALTVEILSFLHSGLFVTAAREELLSVISNTNAEAAQIVLFYFLYCAYITKVSFCLSHQILRL
jgi:hypothetical protein